MRPRPEGHRHAEPQVGPLTSLWLWLQPYNVYLIEMSEFRECIIQTKWKYDVAPEDKQVTFCYYIVLSYTIFRISKYISFVHRHRICCYYIN